VLNYGFGNSLHGAQISNPVIPAIFWRESTRLAAVTLDARQKIAGMTT